MCLGEDKQTEQAFASALKKAHITQLHLAEPNQQFFSPSQAQPQAQTPDMSEINDIDDKEGVTDKAIGMNELKIQIKTVYTEKW